MTVALVCEARLTRELLSEVFGRLPQGVRFAAARLDQLPRLQPGDVVLLYRLGPIEPLLEELRTASHVAMGHPLIVVANVRDPAKLADLRALSVSAVIADDVSIASLVGLVCMIQAGFGLVDGEIGRVHSFLAGPPEHGGPSPIPRRELRLHALSQQENRILSKLMSGASNKDIANELGISESTVKVHLRTCFEKIGVRNRTQAAMWAASHGAGST